VKTATIKIAPYWHSDLADYITDLAWSPDGKWLAAASAAGEVVLHDLAREAVSLKPASGQSVNSLGFSADSQFLAASGQSGEVTVWELRSPVPAIACTRSHPGAWIDRLTWHPQQNYLAYGVGSHVQIWDAASKTQLAQLDFQASSVLHLAWHPQGQFLAVSGHGGVKIWFQEDWSTQPKLIAVPGASLYVAWSKDGRYLGSGNLDRTLTVAEWNSPPPWLMQGFPGKVRQLAWSDRTVPSGSPLLAAACVEGITVWKRGDPSKSGWQSQVLQHHQDRVNAIAFQPGSHMLASAGQDGQMCFWQQGKHLVRAIKANSEGLSQLAWHPSGQYLATGSSFGSLAIWQQLTRGKGFGS
jgi:WD40 repeat protein